MLIIRNLNESDVKSAALIEKNCLTTAWTEKQLSSLPENAIYLVAEADGVVCGIGSMYCVFDDCEIMNIAVSEEYRKRGIASELLKSLISLATERGCNLITLEVAENNQGAIALYDRFGFKAVGKRKGFYQQIDAIVMQKTILEK